MGGGSIILSTVTERAAYPIPPECGKFSPRGRGHPSSREREHSPQVRSLFLPQAFSDCGNSPRWTRYPVHGSVNDLFRSSAVFSFAGLRKLSLLLAAITKNLARENWFRARYGAVNRAVIRSKAHCRDWVNLLIL